MTTRRRRTKGESRARIRLRVIVRRRIRKLCINGSDDGGLALGLVLQHEAYRDGMERSGNSAETVRAVKAHTEMALRMQGSGMGGKLLEGVLSSIPELQGDKDNYYAYMYGLSQGGAAKDAAEAAYAAYVDGTYDSSGDYWKLLEDGRIQYDGRANLYYDENGVEKTILETESKGIEGSLVEILYGKNANAAQRTKVRQLMERAGLQHTVDKDNPTANEHWYWDRTGTVADKALDKWIYTDNVDVRAANMGAFIDRDIILSGYGDRLASLIYAASDPTKQFISHTTSYNLLFNNGLNTYGLFDLGGVPYRLDEIAKAVRIKMAANENAEKQEHQPRPAVDENGKPYTKTFCNFKVGDDYLSYYGDSSKFSNIFIYDETRANAMGENFARLGYPHIMGTGQYSAGLFAQIAANKGKLVTASWINYSVNANREREPGHVATVVSYYGIYDPRLGPRISQAGMTNGEMWLRKGFGYDKFSAINFYRMLSNTEYDRSKDNPTWAP